MIEMKKLIYSLAAAGLTLGACTEFDDEVSKVYPDGPAVTVDVTVSSDNSISYSVTPASGAQGYAYAIVESAEDETVYTADDIISLIDTKSDFGAGNARYVKTSDAASVTGEVEDLTPYGKYVFLAVAYNEYDKAGAVTAKEFQLSDSGAPEIEGAVASGTAVVFAFSENVKVDETGADAGKYTAFTALLLSPTSGTITESYVSNIKVSGNEVYFYIAGAESGMTASIGWESDNAITDLKGNGIGALEAGFDEDDIFVPFENENVKLNVESISAEGVSGSYADIDNFILTVKTKEAIYEGYGEGKGSLTATFSASDDNMSSTIKTSVTIVDEHTFTVTIPAGVLAGQAITAVLEDGALVDANGNSFAGITLISEDDTYTVAKAISVSDVIGTYNAGFYLYTEIKAQSPTVHSETWTIADAGKSEGYVYNVTISGITAGGYTDASTVTAEGTYNALTHILSINSAIGSANLEYKEGEEKKTVEAGVYLLDYDSNGNAMAMLQFSAAGAATATSYWIVYADDENYGGVMDYMMQTTIRRQ